MRSNRDDGTSLGQCCNSSDPRNCARDGGFHSKSCRLWFDKIWDKARESRVRAAEADANTATRPPPVKEPERTTTTATQVTQSSVPVVPATQSTVPDAPTETSETTTERGRDLDVRMGERQPKQRRELKDVEMTANLTRPASKRTCEVFGLLVHADIADNNYFEEGLMNENMSGETENVHAGSLAAISVHNAADPDGWQTELLAKGTIVCGHTSGQPLPEDAVHETRGREIALMADNGMYDIVARSAARGKLVTPGSKATGVKGPHSEDNLITEKTEKFRSLAGRLLYHSMDDPRVQLETGLVMRGVSTTRVLDEARLHRAVRYIAGTPDVDWLFRWQGGAETSKLYGLADADHAADDESRRSVSCSQEFLGCHLLDQEVGRQTCVPMSSEKKRVPRFDLLCETHLHEESG